MAHGKNPAWKIFNDSGTPNTHKGFFAMKIRLALFAATLLLLPPAALLLSEQDRPQIGNIEGVVILPALLGGIILLAGTCLLDTLSFRRSGSSLLRTQPLYTLSLGATGAGLGALLAYLNIFSPLWISPLPWPGEILLAALLGALLLPAILVTRLWLVSFPGLLGRLTRGLSLPSGQTEVVAALLLLAALAGLLGGTVWPAQLVWLLWLSPLLLLLALQLLWHESTVFSGLKNGDWSRSVLGVVSGIILCAGVLLIYKLAGGALYLTISVWLLTLLLGAFGLLSLQLGDVIAESWRGKKRGAVFKKKPFPIPVVVKKE